MRIVVHHKKYKEGGFLATAIAATVVGSLASAGASIYSGISQASAARQTAEYNAQVASNNAGAAYQQSKYDTQLIDQQNRARQGRLRAAAASSGFDVNSGSFTDVERSTAQQGEMDRLARIYQGKLGIVKSQSEEQLAQMQGSFASDIAVGGAMRGAATLIGGIGEAASLEANPQFH